MLSNEASLSADVCPLTCRTMTLMLCGESHVNNVLCTGEATPTLRFKHKQVCCEKLAWKNNKGLKNLVLVVLFYENIKGACFNHSIFHSFCKCKSMRNYCAIFDVVTNDLLGLRSSLCNIAIKPLDHIAKGLERYEYYIL